MYEVELKVRADHDAVAARVRERGAAARGAVRQVDTYYDAPHRSFADTDEALRLRETTPLVDAADAGGDGGPASGEGDGEAPPPTHELTYKGPKVDAAAKTREEFESTVGDADAVGAALSALGFAPAATVEKERRRFELDGYEVVLDDVDGLGEFVEVETTAAADALDAAREGAVDVLRTLSLADRERVRTSYLGLLLDARE
jgi:adenylate cyclase class 2